MQISIGLWHIHGRVEFVCAGLPALLDHQVVAAMCVIQDGMTGQRKKQAIHGTKNDN